jgi:hypothetical protein
MNQRKTRLLVKKSKERHVSKLTTPAISAGRATTLLQTRGQTIGKILIMRFRKTNTHTFVWKAKIFVDAHDGL